MADTGSGISSPKPTRALQSWSWMLLAVLVFLCASGGPFIYDGSAYLAVSLFNGAPHFMHDRYTHALFEWPVVALARLWPGLLMNKWMLGLAFGLPYMASTVVFLHVAGRYLDSARERLIWITLILGTLLPNLITMSFELNHVCLLSAATYILLLQAMTRGRIAAIALFSFAICFIHPGSFFSFAGAVWVTLTSRTHPARTRRLLAFFFLALALLRAFLPLTDYEIEEAGFTLYAQHFMSAVWGAPLVMWLGALALCGALVYGDIWRPGLVAFPVFYTLMGLYWTSDPSLWQSSLDYRRFPIVTVPLTLVLIAWRRRTGRREADDDPGYAHGLLAMAAAFSVVLTSQLASWNTLRSTLAAQLKSHPGISQLDHQDFRWMLRTPLAHWSLPYQCLLLQPGRVNAMVFPLAAPRSLAEFRLSHHNTLNLATSPWQGIWDLSALAASMPRQRVTCGAGFYPTEDFRGNLFAWARQSAEIVVDKASPEAGRIELRLFCAFGPQKLRIRVMSEDPAAALISDAVVDVTANIQQAPAKAAVTVPAAPGHYRIKMTSDSSEKRFPGDSRLISWGIRLPVELTISEIAPN